MNITSIVIQVITGLGLILLVLLHAGKGGGMSDMFGGCGGLSSGTASERELDRVTVVMAVIFGLNSLFLAYQSAKGKL